MDEIIWQEGERVFTRTESMLILRSQRGEKRVPLSSEIREPTPEERAALKKAAFEPAGWYALAVPRWADHRGQSGGGAGLALCPPESRAAVAAALAAYRSECEAARSAPAARERRRIEALRAQARRAYQNGDWADYHGLEAEADAAARQWRADFPAEAREERRRDLLIQAQEEEAKAVGALVYDADGSLSSADQERRAADFRARAAALRAEAEALGD